MFGDYVSVYNFRQSVEDGTIEDAGLDDDLEEKLWKVLGQRYHLITREDRLDAVAKDIVHHFLNRGYQGKAMVVSIDKLTTLRMYEKVRGSRFFFASLGDLGDLCASAVNSWVKRMKTSLRRKKGSSDGHRHDATGVEIGKMLDSGLGGEVPSDQ